MKISSHSSNPNIMPSASAADLAGNQLHMCDPVSCKYKTLQVGISTSSNYNYSCCFESLVGPDYLLPFQVSVDMFVLGCRVEPLSFAPLWIRPNSDSKFPGYIWALTYSTLHSCSMNMFNRSFDQFRSHQSHSLPFNNKMSLEL